MLKVFALNWLVKVKFLSPFNTAAVLWSSICGLGADSYACTSFQLLNNSKLSSASSSTLIPTPFGTLVSPVSSKAGHCWSTNTPTSLLALNLTGGITMQGTKPTSTRLSHYIWPDLTTPWLYSSTMSSSTRARRSLESGTCIKWDYLALCGSCPRARTCSISTRNLWKALSRWKIEYWKTKKNPRMNK